MVNEPSEPAVASMVVLPAAIFTLAPGSLVPVTERLLLLT